MKLHSILTGYFKLDGGAMFGVVPKTMWKKLNPPDENNMCTWAMRCLLIEQEDRKILIDTGIGDKQDEKFKSHFHPHGSETLLNSLKEKGVNAEDITDVILTHLHFDHVGGAVYRDEKGDLLATFPNATYWSNKRHWDWAMNPNPREKASFLKENFLPLQELGLLKFLDFDNNNECELYGIRLRLLFGHTEAMMMPIIPFKNTHIVYCADLMPSVHHLGLPYVMSYDIRPLSSLKEKKELLNEAIDNKYLLFFEHDPVNELASIQVNERGRIVSNKVGSLSSFL